MIIELRKKSQITLPKEIVKNLNLHEGDKFEVSIENKKIASIRIQNLLNG